MPAIAKKLPDISQYYDAHRAAQEEIAWILDDPHQRFADFVLPRAHYRGIQSIVEFASGSARLAALMPRSIRYVGVELNPHFLRMARDRLAAAIRDGKVQFAEEDIRQYIAATTFDLGMAWDALKHFALDEWAAILERLLKISNHSAFNIQISSHAFDNGTDYHHSFVTLDQMREAVTRAGHAVIEEECMATFVVAGKGSARNLAVWTSKQGACA